MDNCNLNELHGAIYEFSLFHSLVMVLVLFGLLSFLAIVVALYIMNWELPQEDGIYI